MKIAIEIEVKAPEIVKIAGRTAIGAFVTLVLFGMVAGLWCMFTYLSIDNWEAAGLFLLYLALTALAVALWWNSTQGILKLWR